MPPVLNSISFQSITMCLCSFFYQEVRSVSPWLDLTGGQPSHLHWPVRYGKSHTGSATSGPINHCIMLLSLGTLHKRTIWPGLLPVHTSWVGKLQPRLRHTKHSVSSAGLQQTVDVWVSPAKTIWFLPNKQKEEEWSIWWHLRWITLFWGLAIMYKQLSISICWYMDT